MVDEARKAEEMRAVIDGHFEWLLVWDQGHSFPLNRTEIAVEHETGKLLLRVPDDHGFRSWRVDRFSVVESDIELHVSGTFGKEAGQIRLVPRTSAKALSLEIEIARLKRANELGDALQTGLENIKVVRIALAKDNGRIAHIFFKTASRQLYGLMADVTETSTPESLLTSALIWQAKLDLRQKDRIVGVWIAAGTRTARNLQKLAALLKAPVRNTLMIAEIADKAGVTTLRPLPDRAISSLWRERAKKLTLPADTLLSETAQRIITAAPDKIDVIYSKQGETLRFAGLPFARTRTMMGQEKAWYGTSKDRQLLTTETWDRLIELIADLGTYRRSDTPNKHHDLYRSAPEAWLESILRQNIKLLDSNLILSPIYNQFRASNYKIDLLALRKDGRLVIIELKTSPDREMVFQAADYWRKIELQRRQGKLADADLFDGRKILDMPAIVYLAAPAWSFHRDYEFFARILSKEIEIWRFELHENWRKNVKVIARKNYSDPGL